MKRYLTFVLLFGTGLLAGHYVGNLQGLSANSTGVPRDTPVVGQGASSLAEKTRGVSTGGSDPKEIISALTSAFQEKQYLKRRVAMYRLIEQIPLSEMTAILDSAQRLPLKLRKDIIAALVERWAKLDANAVGTWVKSHSNDPAYSAVWAHSAPHDALSAVLALNRDTYYWAAPKIALERLAGNDPDARIALLASLPVSVNRDKLLAGEIEELAKTNPGKALQAANTRLTGKSRKSAAQAVLMQWAQVDPAAAAAQLDPIFSELKPGVFGNHFVSEFTRKMAEKDPSAALEFATSLPDEFRKYPLIGAAVAWAKTDPVGALAWSLENGVDITRSFQTEAWISSDSVFRVALQTQPRETIDWLTSLPEGAERQQLIKTAFQDTMSNAESKGEAAEADSPASRLFNALLPAEQSKLAAWFGRLIVKQGTFPEPSEWQSRFGDENVRARAMAGAVGAIFSQSASRGEALLVNLPEGKGRDLALQEIAFAQSFATPELAAKRALEIKSKDVQRTTLDRTVPEWLKRDESACRSWLDSTKEIPASWIADWVSEAKER